MENIYKLISSDMPEADKSEIDNLENLMKELKMTEEQLKKASEFAGKKVEETWKKYQIAKLLPILIQKLDLQERDEEKIK